MVKNLLEDVVYVEPRTDLPVPDGMCKNCGAPVPMDTLPQPVIDIEKIEE